MAGAGDVDADKGIGFGVVAAKGRNMAAGSANAKSSRWIGWMPRRDAIGADPVHGRVY